VSFDRRVATRCTLIDRALDRYVPDRGDTLSRAMRYSLFSGGKRLRSVLLLAAGEAVGGRVRQLLPFACGVEMIHTYSLMHDDLPAMDDDDLRRGKPTAHRVFGEGAAILAGDALLTEAFGVMTARTGKNAVPAARAIAAVRAIARAAGMAGMVGGQVADLEAEGSAASLATVRGIHRRKTGALIEAATMAGGLLAGAGPAALRALRQYGRSVGLAVQIADDLRDAEAPAAITGKIPRRDQALGKATYAGVLGNAATRAAMDREIRRALGALRALAPQATMLEGLALRVGTWGNAGSPGQDRGLQVKINGTARRATAAAANSRSRVGR
jgi:geranylgeranyl diphosphate synthase type II